MAHPHLLWVEVNPLSDVSTKKGGQNSKFETLTLCKAKFKSNVDLFLEGLGHVVLSIPGKKFDSQLSCC